MTAFSDHLLDWWADAGRHDLPWQVNRSPYRVWVSEIMLQQTQVTTVIGYFDRFMARFPTLQDLAQAPIDDVLALWSGLGYYARARNLHSTACICVTEHQGQLPSDPEALEQLPGIGRSTAHAIVAQAHNRRAVILDGNVKRVLTRYQGIDGWPGQTSIEKKLWHLADALTPNERARDYTQAIMDLGATVCTRRHPRCNRCPVAGDCQARLQGKTHQWPTPRPKTDKRLIEMTLAIGLSRQKDILLEKRQDRGIWGGLWCLPEAHSVPELLKGQPGPVVEPIRHELTHRSVLMAFQSVWVDSASLGAHDTHQRWFDLTKARTLGLPRPIQRVLKALDGLES